MILLAYSYDFNHLHFIKATPLQILHYLGLDHVGHIGGRNRYFPFL